MDIQSLHPDILLQIFHAVAINEPPRFMHVPHLDYPGVREALGHSNSTHNERLGWVRLGHVSHTWRITLLSAQALWAAHIGSLPAAVDEMIARAGPTAPITLRLPLGATSNPIVTHLVQVLIDRRLDIRARLRGVQIWDPCPSPNRNFNMRRNLSPVVNELSNLTRQMAGIWYNTSNQLFPYSVLESTLFVTELTTLETLDLSRHSTFGDRLYVNAPNLRYLSLRNCFVECSSSNHLVSISMSFTGTKHAGLTMTIDKVLDLLELSAASLQHVDLNGVLASTEPPELSQLAFHAMFGPTPATTPDAEEGEPSIRVVNLPALKTISLHETRAKTARLLTCLRYSQSTMTCLDCPSRRGSTRPGSARDTDPSIRAAISKYPDHHTFGLYFHNEFGSQGSIDIYPLPNNGERSVHSCMSVHMHLPIIRISADFTPAFFNASSVAHTITRELSASGATIEEIILGIGNSVSQDRMLEMLGCAPRARNICIETQSRAFMAIAYALRRYMNQNGPYDRICLVAGVEPTSNTNLAMMSIVFGPLRFGATVLHIDKEYERMPGGEKMRGYVEELDGVFREMVVRDRYV
ncbi:hypothetical protein PENSPDRAFT_646380 [Peniophora sp. CONT]|nr:hypothetical protein PENSPDRAFT_646380 [Peniophora sp. CONT]